MSDALLSVRGMDAYYGDFQALFGVTLEIGEGEIIAIIGANGAGKSTLFKAISGLLPVKRDALRFRGFPIGGQPAHVAVRRGIAMVPEGRRLFSSLSVEENLQLGSYGQRKGAWTLERVFELFPVLKERRAHRATALSGGQQQMVAIGRALMSNPTLLICDEISLGLAPVVIREIYEVIPRLAAEGITVAIVEQDVLLALSASQRVYCLREGRVTLAGSSGSLSREAISKAYFGSHGEVESVTPQ